MYPLLCSIHRLDKPLEDIGTPFCWRHSDTIWEADIEGSLLLDDKKRAILVVLSPENGVLSKVRSRLGKADH